MSAEAAPPILPSPPAPPKADAPTRGADDGSFGAMLASADQSAVPSGQENKAADSAPTANAPAASVETTPDPTAAAKPSADVKPTAPGLLALQLQDPEPQTTAAAGPLDIRPPPVAAETPPVVAASAPVEPPPVAAAKGAPAKAEPSVEVKVAAEDTPPQAAPTIAPTSPQSKIKAATTNAPKDDSKDEEPVTSDAAPVVDAALAAQIPAPAQPAAAQTTQGEARPDVLAAAAPRAVPKLPADAPPTDDTTPPAKAGDSNATPRAAHANEGKGAPTPSAAVLAAAADVASRADSSAAAPASSIIAPQAAMPVASPPPHGAALSPASVAVAQEIVRRFDGGNTSFQVRLDPPELGRVDIRLEVSRDKKVTATISADNAVTLSDLRGSVRELQRALTDAGLDLADNGLSFQDRRDSQSSAMAQQQNLRGANRSADESLVPAPTPARPFGVERWGGSRVDVWV